MSAPQARLLQPGGTIRQALELVRPLPSLMLDDSSESMVLASAMVGLARKTVLTNSLSTAMYLMLNSSHDVVVLPGVATPFSGRLIPLVRPPGRAKVLVAFIGGTNGPRGAGRRHGDVDLALSRLLTWATDCFRFVCDPPVPGGDPTASLEKGASGHGGTGPAGITIDDGRRDVERTWDVF